MKLKIETTRRIELIDITSEIQQEMMKSMISEVFYAKGGTV